MSRPSDQELPLRESLPEQFDMLVLELMGDVVTYYRSYTLGVRA